MDIPEDVMKAAEVVERVARAIWSAGRYSEERASWDFVVSRAKTDPEFALAIEDYIATARAAIEAIEPLVEQAFRDGLIYGSNVKDADADLAWKHSMAKFDLSEALSPSLKEQEDRTL